MLVDDLGFINMFLVVRYVYVTGPVDAAWAAWSVFSDG